MNLRIVNICNNDCLYCLEQDYRSLAPYIDRSIIFEALEANRGTRVSFYGGNPLLHPDFAEIIEEARMLWYGEIGVLTNTHWLDRDILSRLIDRGLTSIGFYFHSFSPQIHKIIVSRGGVDFSELITNMWLVRNSSLHVKAIIHINRLSLQTIVRDLPILVRKYGFRDMEFINYFPFGRPYDTFRDVLFYEYDEFRTTIDRLFEIIGQEGIRAQFVKFGKDFFWDHQHFFDPIAWVREQIGEEDLVRMSSSMPECATDGRCNVCFIQKNCRWYAPNQGN